MEWFFSRFRKKIHCTSLKNQHFCRNRFIHRRYVILRIINLITTYYEIFLYYLYNLYYTASSSCAMIRSTRYVLRGTVWTIIQKYCTLDNEHEARSKYNALEFVPGIRPRMLLELTGIFIILIKLFNIYLLFYFWHFFIKI